MIKWTTISSTNEDPRWHALSSALNETGTPNEFHSSTEDADLTNLSPLEAFDHVRVSASKAPQLMKILKIQSSWIRLLGVFDGMTRKDGEWWPRCALYESFGEVIIELGQDLDVAASMMIAGAGGTARIAIAAFFKGGFKNFLLTNFDKDEAEQLIQDVRGRFFGMNIQWVPMEGIVLLPGESSVLCNCTPSVEENALLVELSYLNFLKRPGFLFDLARGSKPSLLVHEAQDAGVSVMSGVELAARTDVIWAKWAFDASLDYDSYCERLRAALKPAVSASGG